MNNATLVTLALATAVRENARTITLHEKGDVWQVLAKPSEVWLEWAMGKVWWEPAGVAPWWAAEIRGQWDSAWR